MNSKIRSILTRLKSLRIRKRSLDAKTLNLTEAFWLASILEKYIDTEKTQPQDALDFINDIVHKMSPADYLHCVMLLTREDEHTIKEFYSIEILTAFIEGLRENQVLALLHFYKSLIYGVS